MTNRHPVGSSRREESFVRKQGIIGIRSENQSLGVHMSRGFKKVLGVVSGFTLLGLNIAFVAFFTLWQIADSAAINRMEMATGVDPAQMLPNANLMWIAAHASVLLLLVADVLAIVFAVMRGRPLNDTESVASLSWASYHIDISDRTASHLRCCQTSPPGPAPSMPLPFKWANSCSTCWR